MSVTAQERTESILRANHPDVKELAPGIKGRLILRRVPAARLISARRLPSSHHARKDHYHRHTFSEVVAPLNGPVVVSVEGRRYRLRPLESVHIPAGVAHTAYSESNITPAIVHSAFACASPTREFVTQRFPFHDLGYERVREGNPEFVARRDLIKSSAQPRRPFSRPVCQPLRQQGHLRGLCPLRRRFFPPLPHSSIRRVHHDRGGRRHLRSGGTPLYSFRQRHRARPRGVPHRFLNESRGPMAMVWVYAGDEPERTLLRPTYCQGCETCSCHNKSGGAECTCKTSCRSRPHPWLPPPSPSPSSAPPFSASR